VATVLRTESRWLRAQAAKRSLALGAYTVIFVATVIGASLYDARAAVGVVLVGSGTARHLARRRRYAIDGAAGELETAKTLALLPASFTVINDVEFPGFNVDHVIVGPSGVWAIETKSHTGVVEECPEGVRLNGRLMFRDPRGQARAGAIAVAKRLQRLLGKRYWVEAVVCFPCATVRVNPMQREAQVLGWQHLFTRFRYRPPGLSSSDCRRISQALLGDSTSISRHKRHSEGSLTRATRALG
jgi:hypothetical protein